MKKIYILILLIGCFYAGKVSAQCATPSVIPYAEGFQSISTNNQLPPCWAVSNPNTCLTYSAGVAAFYSAVSGDNYFFSNALQLQAGITYSMSSVYYNNNFTYGTWSNFAMLLSTSQSTVNAVAIATVVPLNNNTYTPLSNTFAVVTSGTYYAIVKGSSNTLATYLTWDNLSITKPCSINSPSLSLSASSPTVCEGSPFTITASGANNYTWTTGANTSTISDAITSNNTYSVVGSSTLSGCISTASISIAVKPKPTPSILVNNPFVCEGSSANLTAIGASSFMWSDGSQAASTVVSPTVTAVFTATGTSAFGCQASASIQIVVNPLPVISASNSVTDPIICPGRMMTLSASGASTYQWMGGQNFLVGSSIVITPQASVIYTVSGTDNNNCTGKTTLVVNVSNCTGLNTLIGNNASVKIYPNPGNGNYVLQTDNADLKHIVVMDVLGKTVFETSSSDEVINITLTALPEGIYEVRAASGKDVNYLKIVKE